MKEEGIIGGKNSVNVERIDRVRFMSLLSKDIGRGITRESIHDNI